MRSRADSYVRAACPVAAVVDRLEAFLGEIGDLVMVIACGAELLTEHVILSAAEGVVGLGVAPLGDQVREGALAFDGKLVAGDVFRAQGDGLVDGVGPDGVLQVGDAEDEVQADVLGPGLPREAEGFLRPGGVVPAVHPPEHPVVEGLDADAQAVHAQGKEAFDIALSLFDEVLRVHFHRELAVGLAVADLVQGDEDAGQDGKRQHRRGAATEIQGLGIVVHVLRPLADFRTDAVGIGLEASFPGDLRIEIAVGAELLAEGDVDVDHGLIAASVHCGRGRSSPYRPRRCRCPCRARPLP